MNTLKRREHGLRPAVLTTVKLQRRVGLLTKLTPLRHRLLTVATLWQSRIGK